LYATDPSLGLFPQLKLTDHQDVQDILKERQFFSEVIKEQLAKAQNRMKLQADQNSKSSEQDEVAG
jgi:predicted CopG family antitoxin